MEELSSQLALRLNKPKLLFRFRKVGHSTTKRGYLPPPPRALSTPQSKEKQTSVFVYRAPVEKKIFSFRFDSRSRRRLVSFLPSLSSVTPPAAPRAPAPPSPGGTASGASSGPLAGPQEASPRPRPPPSGEQARDEDPSPEEARGLRPRSSEASEEDPRASRRSRPSRSRARRRSG